jgi:PAS domain S-box-containing protein
LSQQDDEEQLRALVLEASRDLISCFDVHGASLYHSPACKRLLGYTPEEMRQINIASLIHPEDYARILYKLAQRPPDEPYLVQYRIRRKNGQYIWLEAHVRPLRDPQSGVISKIVSVQREITERRRIEESLRQREDEIEQQSLAQREDAQQKDGETMQRKASLQSPIQAMLSLSKSLQEGLYGSLNAQQAHCCEMLVQNGELLLEKVLHLDDEVSLISSPSSASLAAISSASLPVIHPPTEERSTQEEGLETALEGEAAHLAMPSLLEEALERYGWLTHSFEAVYVEEGLAERLAQELPSLLIFQGRPMDRDLWLFLYRVKNDPQLCGIPLLFASAMEPILLAASPSETQGKRAHQAQQESRLFLLGLLQQQSVHQPFRVVQVISKGLKKKAVSARSTHILLVEDTEINAITLVDYLGANGLYVSVARNGFEAIERAERELPSLIIMDIQMPQMNGIEAIQHLKANPVTRPIPVLVLTALAMSGDRERCLQAGAMDYLSKPVSLADLVQRIRKILRLPSSHSTGRAY